MAYTEAVKKATKKWNSAHESVSIRVTPGVRDEWKMAAEKSGSSLASFISDAVAEKIERDHLA